MIIIRRPNNLPRERRAAVVAIGNFDGVHRGHQALLAEANEIAQRLATKAGAIIFEPHPQTFFRKDVSGFRLTPFRAKVHLLEAAGITLLYALPFDARMSQTLAGDFVTDVLVRDLGICHLVVGDDFLFGKGRGGNVALLEQMGPTLGFDVTRFRTVEAPSGHKISSTLIRDALRQGRVADAGAALGHWWTVEGRVQAGDRRGRTIGFPTANVSLRNYLEPALGVYAVRVRVGAHFYGGVANFGRRPTFDKKDVLLEVHLFDFAGDLYGRQIAVSFIAHLRPEQKFSGLDALKAQIEADATAARRVLAVAGVVPAP